jgi:hypothetical protein
LRFSLIEEKGRLKEAVDRMKKLKL